MRKALWVGAVAVLCLPMVFVGWLLLAANWAKMDGSTKYAPVALQRAVAGMIFQNAGYGKASLPAIDRVLRLDPENTEAWERRCSVNADGDAPARWKDCETAVAYGGKAFDYYNLGRLQEAAGDFCTAEDTFTHATGMTSSRPDSDYLEAMATAALECGHLPASRAGFELAVDVQQKSLMEPDMDADEIGDAKKEIATDEEYLVIVYHREHEDTLAGQACTAAHPGWKVCRCNVDAKGVVGCSEGK